MQRLLLCAILLLIPSAAPAQTVYTTVADHIFCASLEEYNTQMKLLVSGDRVAWDRYLQKSNCRVLKAGVKVYVENAKGIGIIRIRPAGQTVWFYTSSGAIRR
jgi:hypothetical protein